MTPDFTKIAQSGLQQGWLVVAKNGQIRWIKGQSSVLSNLREAQYIGLVDRDITGEWKASRDQWDLVAAVDEFIKSNIQQIKDAVRG